MNNKY
ncbi:uncharacterized protein FFMR_15864 [Fusarium fujikuroi]